MLLTGVQNIRAVALAPWLFLPGLAIVVTVLAFNFVGDRLHDAADRYSQWPDNTRVPGRATVDHSQPCVASEHLRSLVRPA